MENVISFITSFYKEQGAIIKIFLFHRDRFTLIHFVNLTVNLMNKYGLASPSEDK